MKKRMMKTEVKEVQIEQHMVEKDDTVQKIVEKIEALEPSRFNEIFLWIKYGKKSRIIELTDTRKLEGNKLFSHVVRSRDEEGNPNSEWQDVDISKVLAVGTYVMDFEKS